MIFECDIDVGVDVSADELRERHDALVFAIGSRVHRELAVPGRDLDGVHFAMDYLYQRNRAVAQLKGRPFREPERTISAKGKDVIVIGGGDTGMDCISNALREGARSVNMLDVYPELPPSGRDERTPWPLPPKRTPETYALDEGGERELERRGHRAQGRGRQRRHGGRAQGRGRRHRGRAAGARLRVRGPPGWC